MNTPDDPSRPWEPPPAPDPSVAPLPPAQPTPAADTGTDGGGAPKRSRGPVIAAIVAVVIVAGGVWLIVGRDSGGGGGVAVAQGEVANAEDVLAATTKEFLTVADDAGATVGDGAGCYWMVTKGAGEGDEEAPDDFATSVACGPARFAAGGNWLVAPIDASASGDDGDVEVSVPLGRGSFASGDDIGIGSEAVEFVGADGEPEDAELAEPSTDDHAYLAGGQMIENASELVDAGFKLATKQVGGEPLNVHPDASCWIPRDGVVVGDETTTPADTSLVCGPVLALEDDATKPFRAVGFSTAPGDGPWSVVADTTTLYVNGAVALPQDVGLFNPDGAKVPSTDDFTNPDPAAVAADYLGSGLAADVADLPFEPMSAKAVRTPDFNVAVDGRAFVDRIGEGASALIAEDGYQLLAFQYKATPVEDETYAGTDSSSTALVLDIDGETRDLVFENMAAVSEEYGTVYSSVYDTSGETVVVVAAVPADAEEIALEIQNRGVAQRVSLTTGEAIETAPGVDRHGKEIALTERVDIKLTSPRAAQHEFPPEGAGYFRGTLNKLTLRAWDDERQWAPDGQIFVDVDLSEIDQAMERSYSWDAAFDWSRTVTLVLPDGKTVKPQGVSSELDQYQPEVVRFVVPIDTAEVTVRIAPTGMAQHYDGVEYPIVIDKEFESTVNIG